jgi:hypothetical protein
MSIETQLYKKSKHFIVSILIKMPNQYLQTPSPGSSKIAVNQRVSSVEFRTILTNLKMENYLHGRQPQWKINKLIA